MSEIITLCTDFGLSDGYVAAMKGVILSIAPRATLVDISHDIPAQDVAHAAFVIASACPYFAADTVHLIVVDPGVGTPREAIAARIHKWWFVAPDNGVLTYLINQYGLETAVSLANPEYWRTPQPSATFHGRDIFAPAAAHLLRGVPLTRFGPPLSRLQRLPTPHPQEAEDGALWGQVIFIDRFGNAVTNIPAEMLANAQDCRITAGRLHLRGLRRTYGDVPKGCYLALIGSHGYLEIAAREANAAQRAELTIGTPVCVRRPVPHRGNP